GPAPKPRLNIQASTSPRIDASTRPGSDPVSKVADRAHTRPGLEPDCGGVEPPPNQSPSGTLNGHDQMIIELAESADRDVRLPVTAIRWAEQSHGDNTGRRRPGSR